VLKLVAFGFTNREIAQRLDLGIKSIETYRMRGLEKLGMKIARGTRSLCFHGWVVGGRIANKFLGNSAGLIP